MEFLVRTELHLPLGLDPAEKDRLFAEERARGFELKRAGAIDRIWRIPGAPFQSISIRSAVDVDTLQADLQSLPLFDWLSIEVTALASHHLETGDA